MRVSVPAGGCEAAGDQCVSPFDDAAAAREKGPREAGVSCSKKADLKKGAVAEEASSSVGKPARSEAKPRGGAPKPKRAKAVTAERPRRPDPGPTLLVACEFLAARVVCALLKKTCSREIRPD